MLIPRILLSSQVEASTNQLAEQQGTPLYNLPWKIPCKLMNIELKVATARLVCCSLYY